MSKCVLFFSFLGILQAQVAPQPQQQPPTPPLKQRAEVPPNSVQLDAGAHILLSMINSVSTRQAVAGDRIYLETAFPIMVSGKMVVPRGSWVTGTVTEVTKPERWLKGAKGQLAIRFDSLTLPNGVSRNFGGGLGAVDPSNNGTLDREHSKVTGPGKSPSSDQVRDVLIGTGTGAGVGTLAGAASGHAIGGGLIGAAAGGGAGVIAILASKRPDAILMRGTTVEMVLDRPLVYSLDELPAGYLNGRPADR
jgi:hypothetical protein